MCGERISINLSTFLRESMDGEEVINHRIFKRKRFSEKGFSGVYWTAYKLATKGVSLEGS